MPLTSSTDERLERFDQACSAWMGRGRPSRTERAVAKRKWEILSSEYVLESPWYRLRRDACRLPNGTLVESYYVREHSGFSVTFAITPGDEVVFTRQYKHGIGDFVLELPGGMLEPGEDAVACARRELEEETGFVTPEFEAVTEFTTDPTSSTGRFTLFIARNAVPQGHLTGCGPFHETPAHTAVGVGPT